METKKKKQKHLKVIKKNKMEKKTAKQNQKQ